MVDLNIPGATVQTARAQSRRGQLPAREKIKRAEPARPQAEQFGSTCVHKVGKLSVVRAQQTQLRAVRTFAMVIGYSRGGRQLL